MTDERIFQKSLRVVTAPADLWLKIQRRQRARRLRRVSAIAAGGAVVALALFSVRQPRLIDLGPYLEPVKASTARSSGEALARPLAGLSRASWDNAGRIPSSFHLVTAYRRGALEQAVFARNDGAALALFSAPLDVRFTYGRESGVETEIEGIRCEKVDCPMQETYSFVAAHRRYVLVSKSCTPDQAADWMRNLGASP